MLRKKAIRDIRQNLSSFITIFLMAFLGVFAFAGIHAYMDGMEYSGDRFYEENNLQDLWLSGENFTDDDIDDILAIDGVTGAERALVINTDLDGYKDVVIETNFIENNDISRMYVADGKAFDKDSDGMWFDKYLADNLGIKVGDELTLKYKDYKITGRVEGLVLVPDHVYSIKDASALFPTHDDYGFVYMSSDAFPLKSHMVYTNTYVTIADDADEQKVKALIQSGIESAVAVTGRDASVSVLTYQSEVEEGSSYSAVFTFLFFFIAVLSVITTMHRFVKMQRTQIGTLKALGFKRRRIERHYLSYGFYISVVAALLGVIGGRYIIGTIFVNIEATYFEVPNMVTYTKPIVYLVALLEVALITGATFLTCHRMLKESAAETLRLEVPKVKNGELKPAGKLISHFSVGVRWNLRDISRNKWRTITGLVGVIGCTMLVVCAFGMRDTLQKFVSWQFEDIYNFGYMLELEKNISDSEYNAVTDKYGAHTSMTLAVEAWDTDDNSSTRQVLVTDAGEKLRFYDDNVDNEELSDDGIYLSQKLLGVLGYSVGDEIKWSIYGKDKTYTTKIAGVFREPQGQKMAMTRAYAQKLGIDYKADTLYTDEDLEGISTIEGVSLITDKGSLKSSTESMLNVMNTVIALLIVISAVLAVVIIYNLGILSFSEKQYQFATMKVLGFNNKRIRSIYIMQNIWISILGIIIGMPAGKYMTVYVYSSALGDNYDMPVVVKLMTYVIAAVGTFAVAYLVNRMLGRKIKSIDMVSSLKANE